MSSAGAVVADQGDYESHRWASAVAAFEESGGFAELPPLDAERLAWSLAWTGCSVATCLDAFERVEVAFRRVGDRRGVARAALEQSRIHALAGDEVVSAACWARALEQLGGDHQCAEYGLAWVLAAYARLLEGDTSDAGEFASLALEIGRQVEDRTVEAMALYVGGQVETLTGEVRDGLDRLDRSMSLAMSYPVKPMYAGMIWCGVLWTCRRIGDWQRASQWNDVATRWCERESVAHFPAHLSVHRAELARVQGRLKDSEQAALEALEQADDWSRSLLGWIHHQLGETRLCQGDLRGAEAAFACAIELGYQPEPGRSRLLLAQGRPEAALRTIAREIERPHWLALSSLIDTLSVGISIASTVGQFQRASAWADELDRLVARYATAYSRGAACVARGEIALAQGDSTKAVERLRTGVDVWSSAEAPYDAASARALLACAHESEGNLEAAIHELAIARVIFERIGASWDKERVQRLLSKANDWARRRHRTHDANNYDGLTPRQRQVAALVAGGFTNREIANELVISRYTAETHVRNILTALGASSRAQIGAWASRNGLATAPTPPDSVSQNARRCPRSRKETRRRT